MYTELIQHIKVTNYLLVCCIILFVVLIILHIINE